MLTEQIDITGDERGIYGYVRRVASGAFRLIIRPRHGSSVALVKWGDLSKLETMEQLERLGDEAEKSPEFRAALEAEGISAAALKKLVTQSVDDLVAIEERARRAARDAKFQAALERAGVSVTMPRGQPLGEWERTAPLNIEGPPLSEEIITERR